MITDSHLELITQPIHLRQMPPKRIGNSTVMHEFFFELFLDKKFGKTTRCSAKQNELALLKQTFVLNGSTFGRITQSER